MDINSFVIGYAKGKASVPTGGGSGGGVELNIAYGDTAPEDTSKLWVKTTEPSGVVVSPIMNYLVSNEPVIKTLSAVLPVATERHGCVQVGTSIYVVGGTRDAVMYDTIHRFDIATGMLTTLPTKLPVPKARHASAAVGTKIYNFGGWKAETSTAASNSYLDNTISVYDTETAIATTLSVTMPYYYQSFMGCAVIGTKIYLFGGQHCEAQGAKYQLKKTNLDTIYCFDTETDTLALIDAKLPSAAMNLTAAAVGTDIYVFGGIGVFRFDTVAQSVDTIYQSGSGVYGSCAADGTDIYLFKSSGIILRFSTATETYAELSATVPDSSTITSGVVNDGTVHLVGGSSEGTIHAVMLSQKIGILNSGLVQIMCDTNRNAFLLTNTETARIEVGVNGVYKGNENNEAEEVEAALYKDGAWVTI